MVATTELAVERPVLSELVAWVKTLTAAGVSPDKAAEVSRDFLLAACLDSGDEADRTIRTRVSERR